MAITGYEAAYLASTTNGTWNTSTTLGVNALATAFYNVGTATTTTTRVFNDWAVTWQNEWQATWRVPLWPTVAAPAPRRAPPVPTAEEVERQALLRAERDAAAAAAATERQAAAATATELLLSLLDERQRDEFERLRRFTVIAADGEEYRVYRDGKSGNVRRLNPAKTHEIEQFCIHDYDNLPVEDTYIAQMLLLQTDPAAFRRIANITAIRRAA